MRLACSVVIAKESLGEAGFQSAFDKGSNWSLEETVKKVLKE